MRHVSALVALAALVTAIVAGCTSSGSGPSAEEGEGLETGGTLQSGPLSEDAFRRLGERGKGRQDAALGLGMGKQPQQAREGILAG